MVKIDETFVHECADVKLIVVNCKKCRKTITTYSNLKNLSRRGWGTMNYLTQWNIIYNITRNGDIFCECGNHLGFETGIFDWFLLKKNVVIEY